MFNKVTVRDLRDGEYKTILKEEFIEFKYNSKDNSGFYVGNRSKIQNFKEKK